MYLYILLDIGKNDWIKNYLNGRVGFCGFDLKCECVVDVFVLIGLVVKGYNYVNLGNELFIWV